MSNKVYGLVLKARYRASVEGYPQELIDLLDQAASVALVTKAEQQKRIREVETEWFPPWDHGPTHQKS